MDIVSGRAVSEFLQRVSLVPDRYRELVVCTPFLDDATARRLGELAVRAPRVRCGFTLITRGEAARRVLEQLPPPLHRWRRSIHIRHHIHAKVYMALGRVHRESEAIITSANLTTDGLGVNDELGVWFTGRTQTERYALLNVRSALRNWIH